MLDKARLTRVFGFIELVPATEVSLVVSLTERHEPRFNKTKTITHKTKLIIHIVIVVVSSLNRVILFVTP